MSGKIYYINVDEEVKYLGNFSRHPVEIDGEVYKTTEHYFQAAKFFDTDPEWADYVASADWPSEAKKRGKSRDHSINPQWNDDVAIRFMEVALIAKVSQHKEIYDQLINTGDAYIVERADWDPIWGDGPTRDGKNQLGRLWMKIRYNLKK